MPPTSAGTKVKDPEYKNWLRVGLALYYLKVGLHSFIQNEVDDVHQFLLQKLYGSSGVPKPKCTTCISKDVKQNKNTYVWKFLFPCLSSLCDIWLKELLTLHTNPTSSTIYLENCDVTAWPFDPWECAKLYMPRGQPPANTGPAMSDSQALLTLMANCKYFHGKFSQPGITLIKKVSSIRNKVMHSGDMNLSDSDMKSFMQDIIDLLEDPTHLRSLQECKQAVNEINKEEKGNSVSTVLPTSEIGFMTSQKPEMIATPITVTSNQSTPVTVKAANYTVQSILGAAGIIEKMADRYHHLRVHGIKVYEEEFVNAQPPLRQKFYQFRNEESLKLVKENKQKKLIDGIILTNWRLWGRRRHYMI